MDIDPFINALPKAELHLHLEGAIAWEFVHKYSPVPQPETPAWIQPDYRFSSFDEFGTTFRPYIDYVLLSVDGYHDVAADIFAKLVAQNVRYVELSFGINIVPRHGLALQEVIAAIREVVPPTIILRLFAAFNRRTPFDSTNPLLPLLFNTSGIDGIDLHSDERMGIPKDSTMFYARAREQGMLTRAHAGELLGVESVRQALDVLGVKRIEHGTLAADDRAMVQRFIDENITLDMCPTSNVKLRVVEDFAAHPIGRLLRQGVSVTCSTDDPELFGCTLTQELRALVQHQGFTPHELAQLQINAFRAGDLPDDQRSALISEVEALRAATRSM